MSSLDADLKIQLLDEFKDLQRKLGVTMVYVIHDRQEAASIAHRTVILHNGQAVQ